jgi:hypothetical protein
LRQQTYVGGKRVDIQKLPRLPKSAATTVHRVKASLYGAKPPVWRRLEIPSVMTLDLVHMVMQAAFGWGGYHLHAFETVCGEFGAPDAGDDWSERKDEATATLAQVAVAEGAKVVYTYDFGDDWRHDIVVEKIVPAEPGVAYPRCIGGRREAGGATRGLRRDLGLQRTPSRPGLHVRRRRGDRVSRRPAEGLHSGFLIHRRSGMVIARTRKLLSARTRRSSPRSFGQRLPFRCDPLGLERGWRRCTAD